MCQINDNTSSLLRNNNSIYEIILLAAGSRTPHYGSMTPIHDGSRTPGIWDPSNTPGRPSDSDSYNLDDYQLTGADYVPQTPGSGYGSSDHSFSPYNSSSPSGYHGT